MAGGREHVAHIQRRVWELADAKALDERERTRRNVTGNKPCAAETTEKRDERATVQMRFRISEGKEQKVAKNQPPR